MSNIERAPGADSGPDKGKSKALVGLNRAPWNAATPLVLNDTKELENVLKHQLNQFGELNYERLLAFVPDEVSCHAIQIQVGKRSGSLAVTMEKWGEDSLVVVVQSFLGLRWVPFIKNAALEGFRRWRDGTTRELTREEISHYD